MGICGDRAVAEFLCAARVVLEMSQRVPRLVECDEWEVDAELHAAIVARVRSCVDAEARSVPVLLCYCWYRSTVCGSRVRAESGSSPACRRARRCRRRSQ